MYNTHKLSNVNMHTTNHHSAQTRSRNR